MAIHALTERPEQVRPLFSSPHLRLVADAVIAGNSPGLLWADDAQNPRSVLLWDTTHSLYLAGDAHNEAFNLALRHFCSERVEKAVDVFKLYLASDDWFAAAPTIFPNVRLEQRARVFYHLAYPRIPDWRERVPTGFQISEINQQFAALKGLNNFNRLHDEIGYCWKAVRDFRERGFGFCAHNDEAIVCWCTAEYVSGRQCGIGIETVEEYEQRGFATVTASAFTEYCLAQGISAHWDAWASNLPSVRTAEKVGFEKAEEYAILFGWLRQA